MSSLSGLTSLGVDFRFDLVRPILQHCSAETLSRLEQATPVSFLLYTHACAGFYDIDLQHLAQDTSGGITSSFHSLAFSPDRYHFL